MHMAWADAKSTSFQLTEVSESGILSLGLLLGLGLGRLLLGLGLGRPQ